MVATQNINMFDQLYEKIFNKVFPEYEAKINPILNEKIYETAYSLNELANKHYKQITNDLYKQNKYNFVLTSTEKAKEKIKEIYGEENSKVEIKSLEEIIKKNNEEYINIKENLKNKNIYLLNPETNDLLIQQLYFGISQSRQQKESPFKILEEILNYYSSTKKEEIINEIKMENEEGKKIIEKNINDLYKNIEEVKEKGGSLLLYNFPFKGDIPLFIKVEYDKNEGKFKYKDYFYEIPIKKNENSYTIIEEKEGIANKFLKEYRTQLEKETKEKLKETEKYMKELIYRICYKITKDIVNEIYKKSNNLNKQQKQQKIDKEKDFKQLFEESYKKFDKLEKIRERLRDDSLREVYEF